MLSPSLKSEFERANAKAEQHSLSMTEALRLGLVDGVRKSISRLTFIPGVGTLASMGVDKLTMEPVFNRITNNRFEVLLPRYCHRYEDEDGWLVVDGKNPSEVKRNLDRGFGTI